MSYATSQAMQRRLFTVNDYHQMVVAGILSEDDRVELLNGEVVEMSPVSPSHVSVVNRLCRVFSRRCDDDVIVSIQNPIQLNEHWAPQPDLALLRARPDFYSLTLAQPEEVLLVVEVASSSAEKDRMVKEPAYANAGIVEYWIVNVPQDVIEVFTQPASGGYKTIKQVKRGEKLSPLLLSTVTLRAEELLG